MRNPLIPYRPSLRQKARELRKNATLGEILLWREIRGRKLGVEFHRQVPIDRYIVDFYCHELSLALEVDGWTHAIAEVGARDVARQERLEALGVRVLRVQEREVRAHAAQVAAAIAVEIAQIMEANEERKHPP